MGDFFRKKVNLKEAESLSFKVKDNHAIIEITDQGNKRKRKVKNLLALV